MKGVYILIVGDKLELMENNEKLIVMYGSSQDSEHQSINDQYEASDKVILLLCKLQQQHSVSMYTWGK